MKNLDQNVNDELPENTEQSLEQRKKFIQIAEYINAIFLIVLLVASIIYIILEY